MPELFDRLAEGSRDRAVSESWRQGSAMTGGAAYSVQESTILRKATITGAPVRPTGTGDMWGSDEDMPWIYPAHISVGRWRSGSGTGDGFVDGIWLDPDIPTRYSPEIPKTVGVWDTTGTHESGDELTVVQRRGHWEVVIPSAASRETTLCLTTGTPVAGEYPVAVHDNGKNQTATATGTVEILSLNISEELPTGTWLVAHRKALAITGGS